MSLFFVCDLDTLFGEHIHLINQKTGQCGCQPIDTENCFYCLLLTVLPLLFILLLFHLCQYCGIRIFCFQKQFITRGFFQREEYSLLQPSRIDLQIVAAACFISMGMTAHIVWRFP